MSRNRERWKHESCWRRRPRHQRRSPEVTRGQKREWAGARWRRGFCSQGKLEKNGKRQEKRSSSEETKAGSGRVAGGCLCLVFLRGKIAFRKAVWACVLCCLGSLFFLRLMAQSFTPYPPPSLSFLTFPHLPPSPPPPLHLINLVPIPLPLPPFHSPPSCWVAADSGRLAQPSKKS